MEGNGSPASQPKCFKLLRPLVNDVQASGGPGTDWHLPGKSLFYGFMLISCWKMSATNCICVDPQAFCRMILALTLEPIFQKKKIPSYLFTSCPTHQPHYFPIPVPCGPWFCKISIGWQQGAFLPVIRQRRWGLKGMQTTGLMNSTVLDSLAVNRI